MTFLTKSITRFNNWDVIRDQDHAWDQVRDKIHDQVWFQIKNQADKTVKLKIKDPLRIWILHEIGYQVARRIRPRKGFTRNLTLKMKLTKDYIMN